MVDMLAAGDGAPPADDDEEPAHAEAASKAIAIDSDESGAASESVSRPWRNDLMFIIGGVPGRV
ncbi:MAG TPA: hypothetical protein VHE78_09845 [Gemmatimonadaceae bacterium]|nr:hypothetical protein [Gemmatimonadaceae bacterium]